MEIQGWKLEVLDMLSLGYVLNIQGESVTKRTCKSSKYIYMGRKHSNDV